MPLPSFSERRKVVVLDSILLACLLEQRSDPEVVCLSHVWEEMVGSLVSDASCYHKPHPAVGAVVTCASHLELRPA